MKKAIIGIGLIVSGTMGACTQRIIDTIFVANNWIVSNGDFNLLLAISILSIIAGVILCVLSLVRSEE